MYGGEEINKDIFTGDVFHQERQNAREVDVQPAGWGW